jgi:hypothetical protein
MSKEDIQKLEEQIKVLEHKKKALQHKVFDEEIRARTRRLIQKGALLEKYLEDENTSVKETEKLLKVLAEFKKINHEYIERKIKNIVDDPETH